MCIYSSHSEADINNLPSSSHRSIHIAPFASSSCTSRAKLLTGYGKWLHPQTSPANIPAAGVTNTSRHSTRSTIQLPGNWLHIFDTNNFPMRLNHMMGDNLHHTASGTDGKEDTDRAVCTREGKMTERFTLLLPQPISNTTTAINVNSAQAMSP